MKRLFSVLLVIILIFMQLPIMGMATEEGSENDVPLVEVKTNPTIIQVGDTFDLTLKFKNNADDDKPVSISIGSSSSFVLMDSKFKKDLQDGSVRFKFKYNGGSDYEIPITVNYSKDTESKSFSRHIDLPNLDPSKPEEPEREDPKTIIPALSIISSRTITGNAGKSIRLPITVKNSSNSWAVDISATAEIDGDSPLTLEGSGHESISQLRGGRTSDIDFKIDIDQYAENKSYPIKINFQFYNDYGISFTSSETVYIKVENKNSKPLISIDQVDIMPTVAEPGKSTTVGFELKNNGTLDAKDIKLSLGGISNDTFTLSSGFNSKYVDKIQGGKTSYVYFEITPSNKLAGGSHGLDINLSYKDGSNQNYEDSNKFFIDVASNKGKISNLIIENLIYPEGPIGQNKDVTIGFNLKNMGKIDAKNIKVSVESSDQNGLVPKTVSIKKINSISPDESDKLSFVFLTSKDAETRNYPINISVEYEDDLSDGEKYNLTQYVGVYVVKPGEEGKTIPKLIIDRYDFEPSIVKAGDNFTMNLSFFNTNSQKAVKNIKIFLTADEKTSPEDNSGGGNVFTPVESSNTFYIDSISPKGRVEKTITMATVPDAQAKTYTIMANFEYEDSSGEQFTATELIGIPVVQQSKLEIGELNFAQEAFVGESSPVFVEFYNTGKVTLYNMMVKLEGDFQTENGSYYVGNFETGRSEYFEGMVIPMEHGEVIGTLVFTYEDSSGENVEVRKDFTLNVMEPMPTDEFPEDMMPPIDEARGIKKLLKSKVFWIIFVLIIGAAGGFAFYKKRKKKGLALDE